MCRAVVLLTSLLASTAAGLRAQRVSVPTPGPTRADSLLAVGRLAAAEDALYAAVAARPRAPEARGALGLYLASRARFRIAETLFWEAVKFGADSGTALRALAMMAPYRVRVVAGPVVTVPLVASPDPRSLGRVAVRPRRVMREEVTAELDPTVTGLVVGRDAAQAFGAPELWVGERRVSGFTRRVDSLASPGSVRVGFEIFWTLQPIMDHRAGTLTLGRAPAAFAEASAEQVPFLLTFPGLSLVPRPGLAPIPIESRAGRELLRGARWQVHAAQSTILVERP